MSYKIKNLYLEGQVFAGYTIDDSDGLLSNLSKINVFVGANNSGKSRLLREISKIKQYRFKLHENLDFFRQKTSQLQESIRKIVTLNGLTDINKFVKSADSLPTLDAISEGEIFLQPLRQLITNILDSTSLTLFHKGGTSSAGVDVAFIAPLQEEVHRILLELNATVAEKNEATDFIRVYIPTLRSLRYLSDDDIYEKSTRKNYFESSENVEIFTGLKLFGELQKLLLGTLPERGSVARFQKFLSEAFFDGKLVALIPRHGEQNLFVKIGNEHERPIYELGDGIQSVIILTFPIFRYRDKNLLLFVEEPELFLHPGMQRIFLNALLREEFQNSQCFIATHSNHLLDLTLDIKQISIFTFLKEVEDTGVEEENSKTIVENVSNEDWRSLQLLGIQNSSIFLSNCTIWVEGVTDRRYLLRYLELYYAKLEDAGDTEHHRFKQDLHFSFVEYSGANITHWSFLDDTPDPIVVDRLCGRLFLVTDKDTADGTKGFRAEKLKEKLQERYYCLECREIENLIAPKVLQAVVTSYEGKQSIVNMPLYKDYKSEYIGTFIEDTLLKGKKLRRGKYKDESGTIIDKTEFCRRTILATSTFEDLSEEAKDLTIKLYSFIKDHNQR